MKFMVFLMTCIPITFFSQENAFKYGVDTAYAIPRGIDTGGKAPKIKAVSIEGDSLFSEALLKEKQIVLIFYRGEWCPVCNKYLSNLSDSIQYITDKNATVIVVGPEIIEKAQKTVKKTKSDFMIISDTSYQIQKDYDVLFHVTKKYNRKIKTLLMTDIARNNGKEEAYLPIPATYIINQDGIITFKNFYYNYYKRASVKEIINNL